MHPLWRLFILLSLLAMSSALHRQPWPGQGPHREWIHPGKKYQGASGVVGWLISSMNIQQGQKGSINVTNVQLDYVGVRLSFHKECFLANISLEFDVEFRLLHNKNVQMRSHMNLVAESWLEKDEFNGRDLVMGNCRSEPSSIRVTVLTECVL
ncbi:BPI fold-containing family A member 3 [Dasypus novemcinctus]|uniref:BPI fold-containing family A member 3 n=1 Tax=Dasypus novemcinctus TaxID=9361 RepID=UPI0039C9CBDD